MRFPLALSAKIGGHIVKHKLLGTKRFALVLQLEPLHACNLSCTGCGRIREYSSNLKDQVPLEKCLAAAEECDAPMVSICGGEPLLYSKIEALVAGLLDQGRIVYICTNGLLVRRKLTDYLAAVYKPSLDDLVTRLVDEKLLAERDAQAIRKNERPVGQVIRPSKWLYWNLHIDGLERTHDAVVERPGVFRECIRAIRMAKLLGFQVATNTTVYRQTDPGEIEDMFKFLSWLGVDGHTISPGYDYDAAKRRMIEEQGRRPEDFFLTREMTREKFAKIAEWGRRFVIFGTPVYQEFLAGKRELRCSAWAIPTYNIMGWKAPCYLITDAHYNTYQEMLEKVDWGRYGRVNGKALDQRCENCMVHCGFDPSGALGTDYRPGDYWKNLKYSFLPRPRRYERGHEINAFNGIGAETKHTDS
ncbi:MAG: DUF3463 domain-containing protein [Verrucomicrobiae bacterium]|nr:DUF3463 domain-containing protein [Verrucomicrobiae bacterium]